MVLKTQARGWAGRVAGHLDHLAAIGPGARTRAGGRSRGDGATSQMMSSKRSMPTNLVADPQMTGKTWEDTTPRASVLASSSALISSPSR